MNLEEFASRHEATRGLLAFFAYGHLPEELRVISQPCAMHAIQMVRCLPDGPELTTGLRKLLEAKDCFVRAAVVNRLSRN